ERAQRFLVEDGDLLNQALKSRTEPFSGRVSFLPINGWSSNPATPAAQQPNRLIEVLSLGQVQIATAEGPPAHPGIIATAANLVTCDRPGLHELPALLLGRTLLVRDLDAARAISQQGGSYRLVTLAGELLESDGTLIVGTHHAESGILSRKSELREL